MDEGLFGGVLDEFFPFGHIEEPVAPVVICHPPTLKRRQPPMRLSFPTESDDDDDSKSVYIGFNDGMPQSMLSYICGNRKRLEVKLRECDIENTDAAKHDLKVLRGLIGRTLYARPDCPFNETQIGCKGIYGANVIFKCELAIYQLNMQFALSSEVIHRRAKKEKSIRISIGEADVSGWHKIEVKGPFEYENKKRDRGRTEKVVKKLLVAEGLTREQLSGLTDENWTLLLKDRPEAVKKRLIRMSKIDKRRKINFEV